MHIVPRKERISEDAFIQTAELERVARSKDQMAKEALILRELFSNIE